MNASTSFRQKFLLVFFGIILSFVILELSMRIAGFVSLQTRINTNAQKGLSNNEVRILCLGESTTANGGSWSYPSLLQKLLDESSLEISFKVINKGVPGTFTAVIASKVTDLLNSIHPHIVITMMGINDHDMNDAHARFDPENKILHPTSFLKNCRVYKLGQWIISRWTATDPEVKPFLTKVRHKGNHLLDMPSKEEVDILSMLQRTHELQSFNRFNEAELLLLNVIESNPDNAVAWFRLGLNYVRLNNMEQGVKAFERVLEINPSDYSGMCELGKAYGLRNFEKAKQIFQEAIRQYPNETDAFWNLGNLYEWQQNYEEAVQLYEQAIERNPTNDLILSHLGFSYHSLGQIDREKELYKKYLAKEPYPQTILGLLAVLYLELGNKKEAESIYDLIESQGLKSYGAATQKNYQWIKQTILGRNITMISMQYPIRSISPLKRILNSDSQVVFLENETNFKAAITRGGYANYFEDLFAGDFGHCTRAGNQLIAENLAYTILKIVK